jgi:hypothetical protein
MHRRTTLFKHFRSTSLLSAAVWTLLTISSPAGAATVTTYNDAAAFQSVLLAGYYLENFDALTMGQFTVPMYNPDGSQVFDQVTVPVFNPDGSPVLDANGFPVFQQVPAPRMVPAAMSFSSGAYNYSVDVPGDSLFLFQALSTSTPNFDIRFTFGSGINAVGGNFFATAADGTVTPGRITVTLGDGTVQTITDPNGSAFSGFVSINSEISSLTVSATQDLSSDPFQLPVYGTVDNFYTGSSYSATATAPEPQSLLLLIGGLTAGALWLRLQRNTHPKG